ncbi:MAG: GAF domain-containing protein [Desulfobacterales bacterium]|nr:GAF domain-containing protein [Desulfobacterales bacterium]
MKNLPLSRNTRLDQKRVLALDNVNKVSANKESTAIIEEYSINSLAVIPLFYTDTPLGLIIMSYSTKYKNFSKQEIDLLSTIGNQSGLVISQAKLFDEIETIKNKRNLFKKYY